MADYVSTEEAWVFVSSDDIVEKFDEAAMRASSSPFARCFTALVDHVREREEATVSVPDGWRLVPIDATGEMVSALKARIGVTHRGGILNAGNALNDAIAAAPTPPAQQSQACAHQFMYFGDQKFRCCADCCKVEGRDTAAPEHDAAEDRIAAQAEMLVLFEKAASSGGVWDTLAGIEALYTAGCRISERGAAPGQAEQPMVEVPLELLKALWDVSAKARAYWEACEQPGGAVDTAASELEAAMGKAEWQCGRFNASGGIEDHLLGCDV